MGKADDLDGNNPFYAWGAQYQREYIRRNRHMLRGMDIKAKVWTRWRLFKKADALVRKARK